MSRYSELLKDPRWQKKRLLIFERDQWTCKSCDRKDKTLHLHHLRYATGKMPWESDDVDLITLCDGCHEFEEKLKTDFPIIAAFARESNMLTLDLFELMAGLSYMKNVVPNKFTEVSTAILNECSGDRRDPFFQFIVSTTNKQ